METAYQPKPTERRWGERWAELRLGVADPASPKPAFSIALPPPNITGALHMGHALNAVIQDSLCRYHRMRGYEVLWVPGTDHAAIATQNVIERQLAAEGTSKEEIGREEFARRVERWYAEYQGRIVTQLRGMGASCDWTRERFTLDPGYVRVIRIAFKELFDQGLIYRGPRIVNWCPRCESAISDEEVEYQEQVDVFYQVRYRLVGEEGEVVVATTRPETIVADVAVAVAPDDPRFAGLVGKVVREPISGRALPVISDPAVRPEIGTGALKITPGHAPEDFEIGLRHQLPVLTVIDLKGRMRVPEVPALDGLSVAEARQRSVEILEAAGALVRADPITHQVGHCDRCGAVIEPLVTPQWWMRMAELAAPAAAAAREGRIRFHPPQFSAQYLGWLDGLRDWCISRQLWLGHRIPVATCGRGHVFAFVDDPQQCPECLDPDLKFDPDVLDTWFSSSLWPFAILGWPEPTPEMARFYPTSVLSTARDIIYLWVARMVIMGLRFTADLPFPDVIFHATILGADGARQSKSRGNVVDPLEMVERHGADALRGWGAAVAMGTQDARFDETRLDGYARFSNKLWNMVRLLHLAHFPGGTGRIPTADPPPPSQLELADRWILSRLRSLVGEVTTAYDNFAMGDAVESVRRFSWDEVADWYLELVKARMERHDPAVLWVTRKVLLTTLHLLHPIMPFVTDELAQQFSGTPPTLDFAAWPTANGLSEDAQAERAMAAFQELAGELRSWLQELGVGGSRSAPRVPVRLAELGDELRFPEVPTYLAQIAPVVFEAGREGAEEDFASLAVGGSSVHLGAAAARHSEVRRRLERELAELDATRQRLDAKLASQFSARAPDAVVTRERERLAATVRRLELLRRTLAD